MSSRSRSRSRSSVNSDENLIATDVSSWLMLESPLSGDDKFSYRFYSLEEKKKLTFEQICSELEQYKYRVIGSSHGWVASWHKSNRSLLLTDPVVRRRQIQLPPVAVADDEALRQISISCSSDHDPGVVFMSYGGSLAFCVPGGSANWSLIADDNKYYHNFVYSNRRKAFFCITEDKEKNKSELESWDLTIPNSPRRKINWGFDSLLHFDSSNLKKFKYLVLDEVSDELYLVLRHVHSHYYPHRPTNSNYLHKTVDFDVFKIDPERKLLSHIASLDGLALFLGINDSFTVRPRPLSQLKPNSIYFTNLCKDHYYRRSLEYDYGDDYDDDGVFDYESRAFSSFHKSYPIDLQHVLLRKMLHCRQPFWYTPHRCLSSEMHNIR